MTIGFIGLGIMGNGMVNNLQKAGTDILLWNRTASKADPFVERGAMFAKTWADFSQVDMVFTMLAHPEAVSETAVQFLPHLQPNTLWIDCSTVNPTFSREMAQLAQMHHVQFLDAPVAGSKFQAQNAELLFFVGGDADNIARCQPYLEQMGHKTVHVGTQGMGASIKVVVNALLASAMASFAEGMALGQALGLAPEMLLNILVGGPVVAPFMASKKEKMANGRYDAEFPLRWMHKDLHLVSLSAYEASVALPITQATKERYQQAIQQGLGELDFSAIYQHIVAP